MLKQVEYHGSNAVGKTVAFADLSYDTVRLVFTDGTFINAEHHDGWGDDSGSIHNREIVLKSNLTPGGTTNPHEANRLREQGIITQAEHDAFCAEYREQGQREDRKREDRERAEFERLKRKFS